jgi:protein-S-isoprenylcysteine O-methyltransferase Ste14
MTLVLLIQERKLVTYLILGVRVRVALVTLLATGATSHAAKAISREAAQPAQVLGCLLVVALITFILATTRA